MEKFEMLTAVLQEEAKNIVDNSGGVVTVTTDGQSVALDWKGKSMTVTPHPRQKDFVRYDLWNGRVGFLRVHTIPSAAVDLMQLLSRC
jgi:hypothetical protein